MRDILFKGKNLYSGEWVEGSLVTMTGAINHGREYILPGGTGISFEMYGDHGTFNIGGFIEVDPETVGQFTGRKDKNGTKIFEGDIVKRDFGEETIGVQYASVEYRDSINGFTMNPRNDWAFTEFEDCEVIGNIHDETKKNVGHERGGT